MIRTFFGAIVLCIVAWFAIQLRLYPQLAHNRVMDRLQHPFDHRLRYALGSIDPRFGLSADQLNIISQQATDIWKTDLQQDLFVYDPHAQLKINLIYDERQADTVARTQAKHDIDEAQQIHRQTLQAIDRQRQHLDDIQQQIELAKIQLSKQQQDFQQTVQLWNRSEQRHPEQRQALLQQQSELQQQQLQLRQAITAYQQQLQAFNQNVYDVNQHAEQFNQNVRQFNQIFHPRQFDKGLFNGREINIYEFQSPADLRLTLAHELGHALGLKHHADPKGLMYPIMQQQKQENFHLTMADLQLYQQREMNTSSIR